MINDAEVQTFLSSLIQIQWNWSDFLRYMCSSVTSYPPMTMLISPPPFKKNIYSLTRLIFILLVRMYMLVLSHADLTSFRGKRCLPLLCHRSFKFWSYMHRSSEVSSKFWSSKFGSHIGWYSEVTCTEVLSSEITCTEVLKSRTEVLKFQILKLHALKFHYNNRTGTRHLT